MTTPEQPLPPPPSVPVPEGDPTTLPAEQEGERYDGGEIPDNGSENDESSDE
jgi:hypothetical protein